MIFKNPVSIHRPLASYSHQVEISPHASWLVMSGQVGMDENGQISNDITEQTKVALNNIWLNLASAGMDKTNLVKLVFYIVGPDDAEQRRNIINDFLGKHQPCMTVIYVAGLASPALKIEIDAWACSE